MKKIYHHCKYFFTIVLVISLLASCKRNEGLGTEVQPQEDIIIVGFNNNSGIIAYSVRDDSIRSDETIYNLMGSYFDPIMGVSKAGFYVQIRLPSDNVTFGSNPVVDSVALTLAYGGYYGNISTRQSVHVHEVLEDFYKDSSYYSNVHLNYSNVDLAHTTFVPHPSDSAIYNGLHYAPQLRLRLDNSIGQKFINASGGANLVDNTSFLEFFKGLYIIADPLSANGAMLYFNLLNDQSKLVLYYHNDAHDSLAYTFIIDANSARINTFDHLKYTGADVSFQHQIAGDTALGINRLYVQAMAGIKTFIRFPQLRTLINSGNIAINKAELVLPVDPSVIGNLTPAAQLTLIKINNNGTLSYIPDQLFGSSYFGGTYNSATEDYRFNLATYVQKIMVADTNAGKGLYLLISGAAVESDRVILNGPGKSTGNLHLNITYTRLN